MGLHIEGPATGKKKEACGYSPDTTNNRMELQAVIEGLSAKTVRWSCLPTVFMLVKEWKSGWPVGSVMVETQTKGRLVPVKNREFWMT